MWIDAAKSLYLQADRNQIARKNSSNPME